MEWKSYDGTQSRFALMDGKLCCGFVQKMPDDWGWIAATRFGAVGYFTSQQAAQTQVATALQNAKYVPQRCGKAISGIFACSREKGHSGKHAFDYKNVSK